MSTSVCASLHRPGFAASNATRGGKISVTYISVRFIRYHLPIAAVLAAFVIAAFTVPTMANVPIHDDFFYARSVETFLKDRVLTSGQVTTTLLFQVIWGALFASIFGMSYGALRLSTVVITFLGAWALYALCRRLAISRERSALGAALYLFNPLAFVLAFTFMSDSHFTALLIIATYLYVRALERDSHGEWLPVLASIAAALAFLVRQHGILIPMAVLAYFALNRQVRFNRSGLLMLARVAGVPFVTMILYYLWLTFSHGAPDGQSGFFHQAISSGLAGTFILSWLLAFIETMYSGFFLAPLAVAVLPSIPKLLRIASTFGRRIFIICTVCFILIPLIVCSSIGLRMPYIPSFLNRGGLGPNDLLVARSPLLSHHDLVWPTVACAVAALVLAFVLCIKVKVAAVPRFSGVTLILMVALWQAAGVVLPSLVRIGWWVDGRMSPSLDRYLLPLLPMVICLVLWALRDVRLVYTGAWVVIAGYAVFAVAGTRDYLVLQEATWNLARQANQMGVPNTSLDAGATWDAVHLYEYSLKDRTPVRTPPYEYFTGNPESLLTPTPPWWILSWTPVTDSSYVIVGEPLIGFSNVTQLEYSSWLHRKPQRLYLVRRLRGTGSG